MIPAEITKVVIGDAVLFTGDVLECLALMPGESVHCVVTSPPYWGLRDYGVEGMIGLEPTFQDWLDKMVMVCEEVRRVLRKDGTFWCNIGDCYSGSNNKAVGPMAYKYAARGTDEATDKQIPGCKPKDLLMMPARLAIALQAAGWWLRSEIIWAKPNPMPESVTDRPTSAHEKIYLLTKSAKYFYDADAVREDAINAGRIVHYDGSQKNTGHENPTYPGAKPRDIEVAAGRNLRNVWNIATQPFPEAHFATFPEEIPRRCIAAGTSERGVCPRCGAQWERVVEYTSDDRPTYKTVGIGPYAEGSGRNDGNHANKVLREDGRGGDLSTRKINFKGWKPGCACNNPPSMTKDEAQQLRNQYGSFADGWDDPEMDVYNDIPKYDPVPATVMDIFSGAATTGLVALKMHRRYIGIELNPKYNAMAVERLRGEAAQGKMF